MIMAKTEVNFVPTESVIIMFVFRTALHYAAGHVNFLCVKTLVAAGCNVNQTDTWGCTPLHYAAAADRDAK